MKYTEFLAKKEPRFNSIGFEPPQLNKRLFKFQADIVRWAIRKGRAALFEDCGLGKGQPENAQVLTNYGWRSISKLTIGDMVFASDGNCYPVLGVYPKKKQDTYRVHFSDNTSIVVDADHLHICRTNNDRQRKKQWRTLSTFELLSCGNLRYGKEKKSRNYDIPIVKDVQFLFKRQLPISPYVLGALLGDGCLLRNIGFSTADYEVIHRIRCQIPDEVDFEKSKYSKYDWKLITGMTGNKKHPYRNLFIELNLYGTYSNTKFIPNQYLFASAIDRLELLRGLMDTDGYVENSGCCQYYSTSLELANGVVFLIRSLGGIPTINTHKTACNGKSGLPCHTVTFSLATHNPFHLSRKAKKWNSSPRDNGRWIDRIEFEKKQHTICISVDSPDNSYVTENFVVTHNTLQQLEWARVISEHEKAPVLIVSPLAVAEQTRMEAKKFHITAPVTICASQSDVQSGINITNYEKLHKFYPKEFAGIVLDESGILKSFSGATRNQIIDMFGRTPYRLACTATPSPNDYVELGNHAEFLGVMTYSEMLSMFFINDLGDVGTWRLKRHAQEADFWKWICSWAVMLSNPNELGYVQDGFDLPELKYHEHKIPSQAKSSHYGFFTFEANTMEERRNVRRETIEQRCIKAAELVNGTNDQWVLWCGLNPESELLTKLIDDAVEITGSQDLELRAKNMLDFSQGKIKRIVTKPSIAGHGMNWQNCNKTAFVGLSDSWEELYQATRRLWRFGQTKPVDVHIIIEEREGRVLQNIKRKDEQAQNMIANMIQHTKDISKKELHANVEKVFETGKLKMEIPKWIKKQS